MDPLIHKYGLIDSVSIGQELSEWRSIERESYSLTLGLKQNGRDIHFLSQEDFLKRQKKPWP
jgi:hypothetical protein